jgi:hypothetical protein
MLFFFIFNCWSFTDHRHSDFGLLSVATPENKFEESSSGRGLDDFIRTRYILPSAKSNNG